MDLSQTVDSVDRQTTPTEVAETVVAGRSFRPARPSAIQLSSAASAVPQLFGEIHDLYRRRLREVGVIAGGTWWLLFAYFVTHVNPLINSAALGQLCSWFLIIPVVCFPACFVWLIMRADISMRGLRFVEWVYVASTLLPLLVQRYTSVSAAMALPTSAAGTDAMAARFATAYGNFPCSAMIIVYGVFVPNTPRRTVVMLSLLGASVAAMDLYAWMPHLPAAAKVFTDSAFQTAVMLFLSLGTAFYGSFKIGALQHEALAARAEARRLGQYHLIRPIGTGAMGEVYLAEHRLLKRPCAVKLIRPERAGDPQVLARFEREVQATAKLTHPNVVEIYDYGYTEDGVFYYAMEHLDGLSLDDLVIQYGRLPATRALHLFRQLCGALREAHRNGLVHRDIKPINVFVCRRGDVCDVVKLLDFGLVRNSVGDELSGRLTQDGGIVGTPEYMAPEQAEAPDTVDDRSDIYALGGVLHFMLTGLAPFVGKTMIEVIIAHRQQPVPSLRSLGCDVSNELENLLQRCLAKSRDARFENVKLLATAVQECPESQNWSEEHARQWWLAQPKLAVKA